MTYQRDTKNSPPKKSEEPEEEKVEVGETVVPGLSTADYNAIRANALEKAKNTIHRWRQRGPWIHCISCETAHASWVGRNVRMIGENADGSPIFEKVLTAQPNSG